ncbi:MAG: hypothetical protein GXP42_06230 [Chloroflexi bacterium]|nr:hypothetical protein [Chloroflexota bacterium]
MNKTRRHTRTLSRTPAIKKTATNKQGAPWLQEMEQGILAPLIQSLPSLTPSDNTRELTINLQLRHLHKREGKIERAK